MKKDNKVAIMQPYFFPYIGYWQLMAIADKYVIYDDVNYIKQGWVNRNRILNKSQRKPEWLTLELSKASPNKLINEIEIGENKKKVLNKIKANYGRAPFFKQIYPLMENALYFKEKNLSLFLENAIKVTATYLGIDTKKLLRSSTLDKDNSLKGEAKVLDICVKLDAKVYINPIGGKDLYTPDSFAKEGIDLNFIYTEEISYAQFGGDFIKNLSIVDVLMFNGMEDTQKFLGKYSLI